MHLKELTLRGFKSFATATQLTFEPGINAVVGPNGSGKSNVVDALSWVMGEQGAKTLRGGSMADVIFAGTSTRQPLGRAEVSLTIDNSDGALPIEYTEVTISRTLFRSGGSEYAINGSPVRLLDIQELLSDTGMGKEMHVIIGQGRLDSVLTATPEERRFFIEEAAGVLKHRRRKDRALRKLESMTANLNRLGDLTTELRRQLGPLARQAEAARTAQIVQADLRDAKARLLADDLAQAQARLMATGEADIELRAQREAAGEARSAARERVTELETERAASNPLISDLTELWQRLSTQAERFTSIQNLAAERHRSLAAPMETSSRETPEQIRLKARAAAEDEQRLAEAKDIAASKLTQAIEARESADDEERSADKRASDLARALADHREDTARRTGKIQAARSRVESLQAEKERVVANRSAAEERQASAQQAVAAAEQEIVAHDGGSDEVSVAFEKLSEELAQAKSALAQARQARDEARAHRDVTSTRAATLIQSLEPEDGSDTVLADVSGMTGWLREHITVASGWEAAAEAALGEFAAGLLADSVDSAVSALRYVRESGTRVSLAIDAAGQATGEAEARKALGHVKADDAVLATDVVSGWTGLPSILSGTILCADLSLARKLISAGAPRVVTRDGDVLTPTTAIGGGTEHSSILARQATARQAEKDAASAEKELESANAEVARCEEVFDEVEAKHSVAASDMHARDAALAASTAQLGVLRQSLKAATDEVGRNTSRIATIDADIASRQGELETLEAEELASGIDPAQLQADLDEAQARKVSLHEATIAARTAETEARLAARVAEERLNVVRGKAEALERHARSEEVRLAEEERRRIRRVAHAKIAEQVGEQASQTLEKVLVARDTAARLRAQAEEDRAGADTALAAARAELDRISTEISDLDALLNKRDIALAEQRLIVSQLTEKAREELAMEAEALIAEFGPHVEIPTDDGPIPFVRSEQVDRLGKAERKLSRLGKINPLALEEHAALEERHTYLSNQLDDLKRSKADLLKIVADIDERVESVLESAYGDVQKAFEEVFTTLFPGGEGRLVLTGEDTLTAGIEIEARPPGKKVKRLSLLSGGERSLTALAFLFAIFKARPSPFYVLDEVEAALDDTNLMRMLELFKELRDSSQLIVITHQKKTMEIADTLYGVAMRESGVTTVISQRLADVVPANNV